MEYMQEFIPQLFEVCIIPLLAILTTFLVKLINAKMDQISANRESALEKKYLNMLNETISDCVIATTQTYVDALKKQGAFDGEAQKAAFSITFEAVTNLLTEEAKEYLSVAVGDLNLYITQKIEAEVSLNKQIA